MTAVILVLLACSDGGPTESRVDPAIGLNISPATLEVVAGQSATAQISVSRSGDYDGAVALAAEAVPSGLTTTFAPASLSAGSASSTLTIATTAATAPGEHTLTIRATGPGVEAKTRTATLTVMEPPQISAAIDPGEITLTQGLSGGVAVTVSRTNFTGAVALTIEGAPTGTTAAFDPASITGNAESSTLTLTIAGDAPIGTSTLLVRAAGEGVEDATAPLELTVEETPSISISAEPVELTLEQGSEGTVELTVTRTNFTGAIDLTLEGAPTGTTGSFDPASIPAGSGTSTLTLVVAADAPVGSSQLLIRASGEEVEEQTVGLTLAITEPPAYTLTISPTEVDVHQGEDASSTITIARTNFDGAVSLAVTGVPSGVTAGVTPASTSGNSAEITLEVGDAADPGTHTLTITGTADGLNDRTATLALDVLEVGGFSLSVAPTSLEIDQGESGSATLTIARNGGFSGAVELSLSGAPTGLAASVDPVSTNSNTSTLEVTAADNLAAGTYTLTVTGSGEVIPGRTEDASVNIAVTVQSVAPAGEWAQVSAGEQHVCAVMEDGRAYCWGRSNSGQLGNGTTDTQTEPTLVAGGLTWASVSAGWTHSCGVTTDNRAYCWGLGSQGQLGNGSTTASEPAPVPVSGAEAWASVSAGQYHTCGLTTGGEAYCWGFNQSGRLGTGAGSSVFTTRVLVAGDHTWRSLSAGTAHTCGVTTEGEAYCWGAAMYGRLGTGNTTIRTTPALVTGGHTWRSVDAGYVHTCAIATNDDAYCWGWGRYGELGNGGTTDQSSPVLVLNEHEWATVDGGTYISCGITTGGEAYCWGRNNVGQVGNGTTSSVQTTPAPVAGGHAWSSIGAGSQHSCGATASGAAYCWGRGSYGQMGNGSLGPTVNSTPVLVSDP